jgi:uncharacterized protein YoxC
MARPPYEKFFSQKLTEMNERIKTSFILIRQDVEEMQKTVDAMRKYLKNKDKQYQYAKKEDNKIRDEFRKNVNEFTQKISQLKLVLSAVREIQKEVVFVKDLAKIEDKIKTSFKNEIENYKEQVKNLKSDLREADRRLNALENGKIFEKKESWFKRGKKEKQDNNLYK